jgi:hypothetical protein
MKKISIQTIIYLFLLICYSSAEASHVIGSDISYRCTSTPGIMELTLVIYRDCNGIPFSNCIGGCGSICSINLQMEGSDPNCEGSPVGIGTIPLSLVSVRDVDVNPYCPTAKNTCTNMGCIPAGMFNPSVERYEFKGLVNLGSTSGIPSNCCNVRFSFQECCRNGAIANSIPGNFYTEATINRCLSLTPCNSSPELTNDPYAVICSNENFVCNNGASDPDFDSVSYEFTPSLEGHNSSVSYNTPFAFNKPMPWTGAWNGTFPAGIHCDPFTGDISFKPTISGTNNFTGVVAIAIKQWKQIGGVPTIIGTTRRDIQMVVSPNCSPNNPPYLTTNPPNTSNPYLAKTSWEICAGEQLCFTIKAKDQDFNPPLRSDTTYITWNAALANFGATFTPTYNPLTRKQNGPREDEFMFCWQPGNDYASKTPYYFTIQGKDSRCPIPGKTTRSFSVKVKNSIPLNYPVTILKTDSGCGRFYLNTVDANPSNTYLKQWIVSPIPNKDFTGVHHSIKLEGKPNAFYIFKDTGLFYLQYKVVDTSTQSSLCYPTYIQLDSIHITSTPSFKDSIVTSNPTCANLSNGQLSVICSKGIPPYTYALNELVFGTDSVFTALPAANYTAYSKDQSGCMNAYYNIQLISPARLIDNGTIKGNFTPYLEDTSTFSVLPIVNGTYSWSLQNGTILSGQGTPQIVVKWSGLGKQNITIIAQQNSCTDTVTSSANIIGTRMDETMNAYKLEIYPNPFKSTLTITLLTLPPDRILKLYDMQGKLVIEQELKYTQQLNLETQPKGVYILKIGNWHGQVVKE